MIVKRRVKGRWEGCRKMIVGSVVMDMGYVLRRIGLDPPLHSNNTN